MAVPLDSQGRHDAQTPSSPPFLSNRPDSVKPAMNTRPHSTGSGPRYWLWLAGTPLLLGVIFLFSIVLFYLVENSRGGNALERCRHELAAKAEKLDWSAWLPKPVPAESNFFEAPGMDGFVRSEGRPVRSFRLPALPQGYSRDTPFSMADLKQLPRQSTQADDKSLASLRAWFRQQEGAVGQLREAAQRPLGQLARDPEAPFGGQAIDFVGVRTAAQWLTSKARVELVADEPAEAARSLGLLARLVALTAEDHPPFLVQSMISAALAGLYVQTFEEGLTAGLWKGPQLSDGQAQLQRLDVLAPVVESMRAERAAMGLMLEHWPRNRLIGAYAGSPKESPFSPTVLFIRLSPRGWLLQNQALLFRLDQEFIDGIDPQTRQVSPRRVDEASQSLRNRFQGRGPYTVLAAMAALNLGRAIQNAARTQSKLRQAVIACALERHRLESGAYPESIEALAPRFLERPPVDVIAGASFRYERKATNVFVLYSIGWNDRDDGGVESRSHDGRSQSDSGDWVWGLGSR